MSEAQTGLRVVNAHKSFGTNPILRGVDLTVGRGEVAAIIGPSGSGKSTLLRCINQLERLDQGLVLLDGELIGAEVHRGRLRRSSARQLRAQRRRIGFVFQSFNLFSNLTVLDNVAEGPLAHGLLRRRESRALALAALERVGLADKAGSYPAQLSGGQQQRAAIARALALDPQILLLDEPTSALDPELVDEVLAVIRELATGGTSMVIVSHEIGFVRQLADQVVFLDGGQVVERGAPDQVIDQPSVARTQQFLAKVR
jgi:polar amino acid transport system ATP-binding protein